MEETIKKLQKLGLNERQSQAYLFTLENKQIKLSGLAKFFNISLTGASKILFALREKGFVKKYVFGNQKVFMPVDIGNLKVEMIKNQKKEIEEKEKILNDLEHGYGGYSIKVKRIGSDVLVETIKKILSKAKKEVFEFIDFRNMLNRKRPEEYKNIKFNVLYHSDDNYIVDDGKKINLNLDKKYAHILAFDNKVKFTSSIKETVLIENEDIYNTISFLIKELSKK